MSKLILTRVGSTTQWKLNVLSFTSPMYGTITSAQTRTVAQHFPIKATQPDLTVSVIFPSQTEFQNFQQFVRTTQLDARDNANLITLNWPQRDINNWTGIIKSCRVGGMRANYAPRASYTFGLVDSLMSTRSTVSWIPGLLWQSIFGTGMPDGVVDVPSIVSATNDLAGFDPFGNFVGVGSGLGGLLSGLVGAF
jgi:hypothetical protein